MGFAFQQYLVGSLFFLLTFESFRSWKSSLSITEQDQNFILQYQLKEAERDMTTGHKEEALKKFQRLIDMAKAGMIHLAAAQHAALLLSEKGEIKEAHDLLAPISSRLNPEGVRLLHQLAYRKGNWQEAISIGNRAYHYYQDYNIAVINAACHAILGEVGPAIGWLQCAIKEGIPNIHEILAQKEFDPIRNDPLFLELRNSKA